MPLIRWVNGWKSGWCGAAAGADPYRAHDNSLGHILDALCQSQQGLRRHPPQSAGGLSAISDPLAPSGYDDHCALGAYADEPQTPGAPRPAYGHSKDGRDDLKQVLLSLGVSGDGGIPLRVGLRDGNRSDSVETQVAEECLALGLEGMRGIVAESKA